MKGSGKYQGTLRRRGCEASLPRSLAVKSRHQSVIRESLAVKNALRGTNSQKSPNCCLTSEIRKRSGTAAGHQREASTTPRSHATFSTHRETRGPIPVNTDVPTTHPLQGRRGEGWCDRHAEARRPESVNITVRPALQTEVSGQPWRLMMQKSSFHCDEQIKCYTKSTL